MLAEVPLDDLLAGRLKNLVKDRRINTTGHVQFFTPSSFEHLLTTHGLKILDRRRYVPIHSLETIRFLQAKDKLSSLGVSRKIASSVLASAFYPIWARLYYSHYALLCSRADTASGDTVVTALSLIGPRVRGGSGAKWLMALGGLFACRSQREQFKSPATL
jgi:hypothetical protein